MPPLMVLEGFDTIDKARTVGNGLLLIGKLRKRPALLDGGLVPFYRYLMNGSNSAGTP
jgi:hypothetical protein